jgi:hypothetical protein
MDPATTTSSCSEDAMRTNRSLLLLGALLVLGPAARQPANASASPPPSDICWRTANAALQAAQEELRAECSLALAKSAHMTNTHAREEFSRRRSRGCTTGSRGPRRSSRGASSCAAGEDGGKPGIVMPAHPLVGRSYRNEFLLGTAEDISTVLAFEQTVDTPFGTFGGCLLMVDQSPLDPLEVEFKNNLDPADGAARGHPNAGELRRSAGRAARRAGQRAGAPGRCAPPARGRDRAQRPRPGAGRRRAEVLEPVP